MGIGPRMIHPTCSRRVLRPIEALELVTKAREREGAPYIPKDEICCSTCRQGDSCPYVPVGPCYKKRFHGSTRGHKDRDTEDREVNTRYGQTYSHVGLLRTEIRTMKMMGSIGGQGGGFMVSIAPHTEVYWS